MTEKEKKGDEEKPLTREDVLKLIEEHGGPEGLNLSRRNLKGIDLSGEPEKSLDLHGINLAMANLQKANLWRTNLHTVNLRRADLSEANISRVVLRNANLQLANLTGAKLTGADFRGANLSMANLRGADLGEANLTDANLSWARLGDTNLTSAILGVTTLGNVDLSGVKGLDTIQHIGPSTIGIDTIRQMKGDISEGFLRDCGMMQWEIEVAHLYDMALTPEAISEILDVRIFRARTEGPLYIGGIFISYSNADSKFVDKLDMELKKSGAAVWLDRHDLVAGSVDKQVVRALRIQDIVIVVLSENSINSDWVEYELEMARKKEKEEKRDVLCPVSLDDSWKAKIEGDVLWRQLKKKYVLDFSSWQTEEFDSQFTKLLDGIKIYYGK